MNRDSEVTPDDVVETLKFLYQPNDLLDQAMDKFFLLGGAMFTTACQYIVAKMLIRNPGIYGDIVQAENGIGASSQKDKSIATMRDFIIKSILATPQAPASTSAQRIHFLGDFDLVPARANKRQQSSTDGNHDCESKHQDTLQRNKAIDGGSTSFSGTKIQPFSFITRTAVNSGEAGSEDQQTLEITNEKKKPDGKRNRKKQKRKMTKEPEVCWENLK